MLRLAILLTFSLNSFLVSQTGAAPQSPRTATATSPDLNTEKLRAEIKKLQAEVEHMGESSENAYDAAIFTGIMTAVAALLVYFAGQALHTAQIKKVDQDIDHMHVARRTAREQQLLAVFKELGESDTRVRMGAISILLQILNSDPSQETANGHYLHTSGGADHTAMERKTIIRALIAVTKSEEVDWIQKFIADGLARTMDAIRDKSVPDDPNKDSPLAEFDFQGARLENAWWKGINARGVDFYSAHLKRASLRDASLQRAVFKNGSLEDAVLSGADLTEADLRGADLRGATFDGAKVDGTKLEGAIVESADVFENAKVPNGFDASVLIVKPKAAGGSPASWQTGKRLTIHRQRELTDGHEQLRIFLS